METRTSIPVRTRLLRRFAPLCLIAGLAACADPGTGATQDQDGDGLSAVEGDCDDANSDAFPGAPDPVADGVDTNCDGVDGADADADG